MDNDLKAEPMTERQLTRWLSGETSRRILVVPFGGSIPHPKSPIGVDLDGEWFDAATDIYGDYPALKASRRRVVDWHHNDAIRPAPPVSMKGTTLGEINLDEFSEEDGLWADWWTKVGEENMKRVALLERMGTPLFGSTQAVPGGPKINAKTRHIDVWPVYRHTITTAPINRGATVPPLKAVLDAMTTSDLSSEAMKAVLVGLDAIHADLLETSGGLTVVPGDSAAKAGRVLSGANETEIRSRLGDLSSAIDAFEAYIESLVGSKETDTET